MTPDQYLGHLRTEADALLAAAAVDPGATVPSCPGWTVRDLVRHVGTVWARATDVLTSGQLADGHDVARRPLPEFDSDDALLAWGQERADEVVSTVERVSVPDPEAECWTFLPPHTRGFWARRMALETALHGWDCRGAVGRRAPMDADLAADGIDEFLFVMLPRCLDRNPGGWSGETLRLHRTDGGADDGTDGGGEWLVRLDAGKAAVERGHARADMADVAVRGPASDLYLWCSGRATLATLPALEAAGDRRVAEEWSAEIRF